MTGPPEALRAPLQAALLLGILLVAPELLTNDYYVSVLIFCVIHALPVLGLNLLLGHAGQISLGHAAFYGLGAYGSAVATATYGLPMEAGLVIALALSCGVALAIGAPCLKLSGHYLAMATLGFGVIVSIVFNEWIGLTGGPSGFVGIPRLALFGFVFWEDIHYYYLCSTVVALAALVSLHLTRSRFGRALEALHTSEGAAACFGVDVAKFKLLTFVLSAAYAGLGGFLYAHYLGFVAPGSFGFLFSVELVTMVVLGGMGNLWGALAGAFFLTSLPEFLRAFENVEHLILGAILIVCMMFMPKGIAGGVGGALRTAARGVARRDADPPAGGDKP